VSHVDTPSPAASWFQVAHDFPLYRWKGRVTRVQANSVESMGPRVALGELCEIQLGDGRPAQAEVVSLREGRVLLMPYGDTKGLTVGAEVIATGERPNLPVGPAMLGRVIDAFGVPLDGGDLPPAIRRMPLRSSPINPLDRTPIKHILPTGLRAIDGVLPLGRGQRMGIFAGSGIGKSSLMGMLARNVQADVNVVALIGERGREVQDFLEQNLTAEALQRTVVVVATSDQAAVVRARAAYAATAVAEYFRDEGKHVFLLMDSVTRFAMARREIDLAAGQPATARGYTPSVFSEIPALCERCGSLRAGGSITAMYTVLVEGDDHNEPIADSLRATLDGQVVLSRELANEGHYPAIDVLQSISRLERHLIEPSQFTDAKRLRAALAVHHRHREMVDMGLYKPGANAELDEAIRHAPQITSFLRQGLHEVSTLQQTRELMSSTFGRKGAHAQP
jgi:flagellum-specific ATP synthase